MLTADNVSFRYGKKLILNRISVSVPQKGITMLIGPNGAGKSTLLQLLAGYRKPSGGCVMLDGNDLQTFPDAERSRRIGVVPQNVSVFAGCSVRDFMLLKANLHRRHSRHEYGQQAANTLAEMGLQDFISRNMDELSAGERQHILLASSLMYQPEYLLLDEPSSALDPEHVIDVMNLLKHLPFPSGVLMITHDLQTAMTYGDRIILMNHGEVYVKGTPEQVLTQENIQNVYHCESEVIRSAAPAPVIFLYKEAAASRD